MTTDEMPKVMVHDLPNNSCFFHDPDDVEEEADTYALATFGGSYFPIYYVIPQDSCGRPLDVADALEALLQTHEGSLSRVPEDNEANENVDYRGEDGFFYDIDEVHIKEISREDWEFLEE